MATTLMLRIPGNITFELDADAAGLTVPLPWGAGDSWEFWAPGFTSNEADGWQAIDAEKLSASDTLTLRSSIGCGTIRITGVFAEAPPLFARTENGRPVSATFGAQGTEIRGLTPGLYVVGTEAWVDQLSSRSQSPFSLGGSPQVKRGPFGDLLIQVESGAETALPWDPRWCLEAPIEGQVVVDGLARDEIAALPIYGALGTKIYFGAHGAWRYCDSEGRFETAPAILNPSGSSLPASTSASSVERHRSSTPVGFEAMGSIGLRSPRSSSSPATRASGRRPTSIPAGSRRCASWGTRLSWMRRWTSSTASRAARGIRPSRSDGSCFLRTSRRCA